MVHFTLDLLLGVCMYVMQIHRWHMGSSNLDLSSKEEVINRQALPQVTWYLDLGVNPGRQTRDQHW